VRPLIMRPERLERLQQHVMMFFTGYSRTASEVAKDQIEQIPNKKLNLRQMMQNVDEAEAILLDKSDRLDDFGRLLHEQWKLKRELSSKISTSQIDEIYETGIKIGALGGKLIGPAAAASCCLLRGPSSRTGSRRLCQDYCTSPAASISWAARSFITRITTSFRPRRRPMEALFPGDRGITAVYL